MLEEFKNITEIQAESQNAIFDAFYKIYLNLTRVILTISSGYIYLSICLLTLKNT